MQNKRDSHSPSHSAFCILHSAFVRRHAFTLIEMLTVVAVLIIVLGLMVSLARYVRDQSANQLTASLLHRLDTAAREYADQNDGQLPPVTPLIGDNATVPDELTLHRIARRNNEDFVRALREFFVRSRSPTRIVSSRPASLSPATAPSQNGYTGSDEGNFDDLPTSIYDEVTLRDAWGDPIVFMPHDHPAIGMASRANPSFFFSAGPDHKYLTRDDNLYSYESTPN